MNAYRCLSCGCVHGWVTHPLVTKVKEGELQRYTDCSRWKCPACGRWLDTRDGGMFGNPSKTYEEVNPDKLIDDRRRMMVERDGTFFMDLY